MLIFDEREFVSTKASAQSENRTAAMRILFLGLNYDPERIGISVYSSGLCKGLVQLGHEVSAIVAKPYYPQWHILPAYRTSRAMSDESGVRVKRIGLYVPTRPTGIRRIAHHISFALNAIVPMLYHSWRQRPDLVITVAPSLASAPIAFLSARLVGARCWLHVQDLEVEAAMALGLLRPKSFIARLARRVERCVLRLFDEVSSISGAMCRAIDHSRAGRRPAYLFRNWATIDPPPSSGPSARFDYRAAWAIDRRYVALYSGNIANKQGIEILIDAARLLHGRADLQFVICGDGPNRRNLEMLAHGLDNVVFRELQPPERLADLLDLASVHLLPQKAGAADLMLPSKLTNMLASGRPVVATAALGTGLAYEVEGCGLVTPPDDAAAFAAAIARLIDDPGLYQVCASTARTQAHKVWGRDAILARAAAAMEMLVRGQRSGDCIGDRMT